MRHVIRVTLALILVSTTLAELNDQDEGKPKLAENQNDEEEKYSWDTSYVEHYHTIDPDDIKNPAVGVLKQEDYDSYKTALETMDLDAFSSHDFEKLDPHETSRSKMSEYHPEAEDDEKTITIIKHVEVPYPVEKSVLYPVIKNIPYPVKVPVPQPYPIEKSIPYPVKVMIKVPVKIPRPIPVYKEIPYAVQVPIERRVPHRVYIPDPFPVERKIHYEVKVPVPEPFPIERPVPVPVKVSVAEPHPFPVEKHVPYPVEVKVDKPRPIHISKPYPVPVIKHVPYPVYKPRPVPVEVKVDRPVPYTVYKHVPYPVEVPVPHPYPVEKEVPYPVVKYVHRPVLSDRHFPVHGEKSIQVEQSDYSEQVPSPEYSSDVQEIPQADEASENNTHAEKNSIDETGSEDHKSIARKDDEQLVGEDSQGEKTKKVEIKAEEKDRVAESSKQRNGKRGKGRFKGL